MTRGVAILGSTGSIGTSTPQVMRRQRERFRVVALTAHSNAELLEGQVAEWHPAYVGIVNGGGILKDSLTVVGRGAWEGGTGNACLVEAATHTDVGIVVNAIVGAAGLEGTVSVLSGGVGVVLDYNEYTVDARGRRGTASWARGGGR